MEVAVCPGGWKEGRKTEQMPLDPQKQQTKLWRPEAVKTKITRLLLFDCMGCLDGWGVGTRAIRESMPTKGNRIIASSSLSLSS
jgi:hypothetical protein